MRTLAINFIQRSQFNRWLAGVAFLFITGLAVGNVVAYPIRTMYYGLFTGDYFLNVISVTPKSVITQGEDLSVVFCRNPRTRVIARDNVRSFYNVSKDTETPVYERKLPDGISYENTDTNCLLLTIKANNMPQTPGRYKFCQGMTFNTLGFEKHAMFCSTEYELVNAASHN